MRTTRFIIATAFVIICCLQVYAQTSVTNVWAEERNGKIAVHYSLATDLPVNIYLKFSIDNGTTWFDCKSVTGDLKSQKAGSKTIIWDCLRDDWEKGSGFLFRVIADDKKLLVEQKAKEEKRIADSIRTAQRIITKEKRKIANANQNLNGHYISLGTSATSSGYYGVLGMGYEYRYHILGVNFSIGWGWDIYELTQLGNIYQYNRFYINANAGFKLYLANKTTFLRNLYFNFLPFSYFGQDYYYISSGNSIIAKSPHLFGVGLFFGYSPVWRVGERVSFGVNMDFGIKANYKFDKWLPVNFDFGFVLKFDSKVKNQ